MCRQPPLPPGLMTGQPLCDWRLKSARRQRQESPPPFVCGAGEWRRGSNGYKSSVQSRTRMRMRRRDAKSNCLCIIWTSTTRSCCTHAPGSPLQPFPRARTRCTKSGLDYCCPLFNRPSPSSRVVVSVIFLAALATMHCRVSPDFRAFVIRR